MKKWTLILFPALVLLGMIGWFQFTGVAPGEGLTFLVDGDRVEPVRAGARYLKRPGVSARTVPQSGRLLFPEDDSYRLFSRDGAEIPAVFEITWSIVDPNAAVDFLRTGGESFEHDVIVAALKETGRPAAAAFDAAAIYDARGSNLLDALGRELVLPRGVDLEIVLNSLTMSASGQQKIVSAVARRSGRRVLFVGVDALDWQILDPLRTEGRVPAFDRLIRRGVRGDLKTLTPMLSPLIWTSMATGVGPETHGILDFVTTDPSTGKTIPVTSLNRNVPAFWNIATFFQRRVDVIGWLATWPAESISGHMVSDRFGFLAYAAGVRTESRTPDVVHPPAYLDSALALVQRPEDVRFEKVTRFLDITREEMNAARGAGFKKGNLINNFILTYATAESYRRIAVDLLKDGADVHAVYFEFIDAVCHLFMPYAPPRRPDVSVEDFDRYRDAVKISYIEMDRMLGSLIDAADDSTIVIVASDHGFLSGARRPPGSAAIEGGQAGRWHRDPGVLIMAGPGIRRGASVSGASVMDMAPTLLHLMGLPVSAQFEGKVLKGALVDEELTAHPVRTVERYVLPPDIWSKRDAPKGAAATPGSEATQSVNLGLVLEQKGQFKEAEAEYRKAIAADPDNAGAVNNLGNVLHKTGRIDEAITLFKELLAKHPDYAPVYQNLGVCYLKKNDPAGALTWLDKAVEREPGNVAALINRGHARLRLRKSAEAKADFDRAVQLDPKAANAWFGIGLVAAEKGDYPAARTAFEKALALDPKHASARENLERLRNL